MISQRVSTVQNADDIIVLEDGKITQRGTHEALVQEDGFYQELYHRQLLESQVNTAEADEQGQTAAALRGEEA